MRGLLQSLDHWTDERVGHKKMLHEVMYENIPGGARWRFVSGSMLVFAFVTQAITGMFLWMAYSPSSQTAWESVYYIQHEMTGGWLLRGVHHFMAQAMVVLLPIHLLQVVLDKAYKSPREFNYWIGLILMLITLALGLTGYLLPWDQKGYWATKVATNLMSLAPGGAYLQKLVVGGSDYGHATLTRFFALHAGVLPALLVMFLVLHLGLFRKHGITSQPSEKRPDQFFWPHQMFKDSMACLVLLVVVLLFTIRGDVAGALTLNLPAEHRGAEMSAPADPSQPYDSARPEWYFLFLFQMLKKFHSEFFGAIVLPALIVGYLFLMPLIARVKFGHALNVVVLLTLIATAGYLTYEAFDEDYYAVRHTTAPADDAALAIHNERLTTSQAYLAARAQAEADYQRVKQLIDYYGIPREGAIALQRNDSETMGPRLFAQHCASCHAFTDREGEDGKWVEVRENVSAPNLKDFAGQAWFHGFLKPELITSGHVFGNTAHADGEMVYFIEEDSEFTDEEIDAITAALVAEAELPWHAAQDAKNADLIEQGRELIVDHCTGCHKFRDDGDIIEGYPDLTGYGTEQWLTALIANVEHERFYAGSNDRMPLFAIHEEHPEQNLLTEQYITLLARWLRGDDRYLGSPPAEEPPEDASTTAAEQDNGEAAE